MALDMLSSAWTIACSIKAWFDANMEARKRAAQFAPALDIIRNNLNQIKTGLDEGKLEITSDQRQALDNAVATTFEVLRDCYEIMNRFDAGKRSKLKKWFISPNSVIDDIAKKRGDIIACVQLVGFSMQTCTFLKSVAATPKSTSEEAGVINIVPDAKSAAEVVQNQMADSEARAFWMSNFNGSIAVPFDTWYGKLNTAFGPFDDTTKDVIKLNVDDENRGHVLFIKFKNWLGTGTLREALATCKVDQTPVATVVVVQPPPPPPVEVKADGVTPVTPSGAPTPTAAAPESAAPVAPELKGVCDPKNPPADLQVIWADPNHSEWNLDTIAELTAAGVKMLCFERQSEVIAFFTAYPAFLRSPKLRVMSNNRMPGSDDFKTQSAATEVVNFIRKKRSMIPVLIYCGGTIDNAREIAKKSRKVNATDDMDVALSFAKGDPIPW